MNEEVIRFLKSRRPIETCQLCLVWKMSKTSSNIAEPIIREESGHISGDEDGKDWDLY